MGVKINLAFNKESLRISDMTIDYDTEFEKKSENEKRISSVESLEKVDNASVKSEKPSNINQLISSRLNRNKQ